MDYQGVAKVIARALRSESGRQDWSDSERDLKMDEGPRAKESGRPLGVQRQGDIPPPASCRTDGPTDTLILAQWVPFWTFVLWNCEIINLHCFKPLNIFYLLNVLG